jgi:hypothetical protein
MLMSDSISTGKVRLTKVMDVSLNRLITNPGKNFNQFHSVPLIKLPDVGSRCYIYKYLLVCEQRV